MYEKEQGNNIYESTYRYLEYLEFVVAWIGQLSL